MTEESTDAEKGVVVPITASSDDDSEFRIVATTALPDLREVRLYRETVDHIREQHPEFRGLPSVEHAVLETISNPTAIYRSRTMPDSAVVFESFGNTLKGNPCTVPVKIIGDTSSGRVTTAMFGKGRHGEELWRSEDV